MEESNTAMTKPKEEIETINVPLDIKPTSKDYTLTSVLDELEDVLDSMDQANTPANESKYSEEDISSNQVKNTCGDVEMKVKEVPKGMDVISCSDCNFKTNSENILGLHRNYKHGTNLQVIDGSKTSLPREQTYKVVRIRHGRQNRGISRTGELKTCSLCNLEICGMKNLRNHYRKEHKGKSLFNCEACDYGSNWAPNMRNHKEAIHDPKTYQCDLCGYENKWKSAFLEHKREKHGIFTKVTKFSNAMNIPVMVIHTSRHTDSRLPIVECIG